MSYAGKVTRGRLVSRGPRSEEAPSRGMRGAPRSTEHAWPETDWKEVAIFGAGVALGLALGAGTALLFAPRSGRETRQSIARAGRGATRRTHDAWDDLRYELRRAARRGRHAASSSWRERRLDAQHRRARRRAREMELERIDD